MPKQNPPTSKTNSKTGSKSGSKPKSSAPRTPATGSSRSSSAPKKSAAASQRSRDGASRHPLKPGAAPPIVYLRPQTWLDDTRAFFARYGRELFAVALIVGGLVMVATEAGDLPSLSERLFGWTATLVALTLVAVGVIILLGPRAGFWSAEALVGAELLLLSLQAGTYVRTLAARPDALYARDGSGGGIVGWALGSLLVNALGAWLALLLIVLIGIAGVLMLLRYTPALYAVALAARRYDVWRRRRAQRAAWAAEWEAYAAAEAGEEEEAWQEMAPDGAPLAEGHATAASPQPSPLPPFPHSATSTKPSVPHAQPPAPPAKPSRFGKRAKVPAVPPAQSEALAAHNRLVALLPPLDLLTKDQGVYTGGNVDALARRIEQTLDDFDVPVKVVHTESGPTVTQFGVEPLYVERAGQKRKVRVSRILALADDLALALAAPAVRIEAPVPGRPYVGIEVPNVEKSLVSLRGIIETDEFHIKGGSLALPMGRNTSGAPIVLDLGRAPHMLIAGATGSGKSVCINTMIMGLLMRHSPATLRFLMVDPKRVELTGYNGIPHLIGNVITDVDQVMAALTWLTLQMDDRYRLFNSLGVRNIDAYNALMAARAARAEADDAAIGEQLPYIVLIVDELADLMMTAAEDVEKQLCRLAQLSRATGIHLVLATQRPSVDVVTGQIKANFPTRVAFAVSSAIDSRVILDTPGAERLLGRGDMLLMRPDAAKLLRVQGCLVTDDEIGHVVGFWTAQAPPATGPVRVPWAGLIGREEDGDDLVQDAIDALEGMQACSTSMLQRKLRIGYPRAARLMEQLEAKGVVGPDMGGGQGREVIRKRENEEETEALDVEDAFS
jgi:S-DNA-T family DNA segregation ATPase FtsK/SpoIIIE